MACATSAAALQLRVLAAQAIAPLVSQHQALATAAALLEGFPGDRGGMERDPNEAHGVLLMVHALVVAGSGGNGRGSGGSGETGGSGGATAATAAQQWVRLATAAQARLLWVLEEDAAPAALQRDATRLLAVLCKASLLCRSCGSRDGEEGHRENREGHGYEEVNALREVKVLRELTLDACRQALLRYVVCWALFALCLHCVHALCRQAVVLLRTVAYTATA